MPLTIIGAQKTRAMRAAKYGGAPAVTVNPEGAVIGGEPALERPPLYHADVRTPIRYLCG
ncbi:hypothetical protein NN6n1_30500 [Shinella zoogloeoides]